MKQIIIQAGEVVRVEKVIRGALLGYSEQEWTKKARVEQGIMERYYGQMGGVDIAFAVLWTISMLLWFQDVDTADLLFPLMWGGLGVAQLVGYYFLTKKNRNPVAIPGLYENGIQLPNHFFLPYPEIGKIERKAMRLGSFKKKDIIRLRSKFAKKPGSFNDGWTVSVDFLGTGGMVELKERIEMDRGLKTRRPSLVVYGRGGAKFQERGMEPIRGAW